MIKDAELTYKTNKLKIVEFFKRYIMEARVLFYFKFDKYLTSDILNLNIEEYAIGRE